MLRGQSRVFRCTIFWMGDEAQSALKRLAVAVRKARDRAGLTQEQAAFSAGMSVRHYQELESGRLNPSYLVLRAVAKATGTTIARLASSAEASS